MRKENSSLLIPREFEKISRHCVFSFLFHPCPGQPSRQGKFTYTSFRMNPKTSEGPVEQRQEVGCEFPLLFTALEAGSDDVETLISEDRP